MEKYVDLIICVRDLIFSSKIVASARANSVDFKVVRDPPKLLETHGKRLIIDLNTEGAVQLASDWKAKFGGPVTGFVSHVNAEVIAQAREAGIDQVLSNGGFSAQVDRIVSGN